VIVSMAQLVMITSKIATSVKPLWWQRLTLGVRTYAHPAQCLSLVISAKMAGAAPRACKYVQAKGLQTI